MGAWMGDRGLGEDVMCMKGVDEHSEQVRKRRRFHDRIVDTGVEIISMDSDFRSPYSAANCMLRELHAARLRRQQPAPSASGDGWSGFTRFALKDVVCCSHVQGGRCLQCTDRSVTNVAAVAYAQFCHVFQSVPESGELEFAAVASLFGELGVSHGETFLHVGSGTGRAVVSFALMHAGCSAAGVEMSSAAHRLAVGSAGKLSPDVGQRVHLHCGNPLSCKWREASIILVSSTGFDDQAMSAVAQRLWEAAPGTRAVTLSQPLPSLRGLELVGHALYRTSRGNVTAFVYRRPVY